MTTVFGFRAGGHRRLGAVLVACLLGAPSAAAPAAPDDASARGWRDPFAYCAAAGTIDAPDARYRGTPAPPELVARVARVFELPADSAQALAPGLVWRCVDGRLWACVVGANLPCSTRGDTGHTPSTGMIGYCGDNPEAEFIPAYAAGRSTVFDWRCREGKPEIIARTRGTDARGFLQEIWREIPPGRPLCGSGGPELD